MLKEHCKLYTKIHDLIAVEKCHVGIAGKDIYSYRTQP